MPYPTLRPLTEEEWAKLQEMDGKPPTEEEIAFMKVAVQTFRRITLNGMKEEKAKIESILSDWGLVESLTNKELNNLIESLIEAALGWDKP
jgi:hypothetical protein